MKTARCLIVLATAAVAMTAAWLSAAPGQSTQRAEPAAPFKVHAVDPILELGSPDGKWAIWRKDGAPGRLYLRTMATRIDRAIANIDGVASGFAWSRDSRFLALTSAASSDGDREQARLLVLTMPSGEVRDLALPGTYLQALAWTNAGDLFYKAFLASSDPLQAGTWQYSTVKSSGGEPRVLLALKGQRGFLPSAITPDGTALIGTADGGLVRHDLATGKQQPLGLAGAVEPMVSPDGKAVAYFKGTAVYVASLDSVPVTRSIQLADVGYNHDRLVAWWTNDGQFILTGVVKYAAAAYRVDVDARTGVARGPLRLLVRNADYPKISPDSRRVAHTPYEAADYAASIGADGTARLASPDNKTSQMLGWRSPQVALIYDKGGSVSAWDTKTGSLSSVTMFTEDQEEVVRYVPVTDEVLYAVGKGKALVLKARAIATGIERVIPTENSRDFSVSPDGHHIVYSHAIGDSANALASSELVLATMDGRREKTLETTSSRGPREPACWSPDGKLLLYYDWKKGATPWYVLNVETLAVRPLLDGSERAREWLPPLIRAQQGASASFVITGPVEWESASYPGTAWSPDGSFIVLGGYSTWREAQGKVWEGVTYEAIRKFQSPSGLPQRGGS